MRTLITMTALVYAVGFYSFGGATMAQRSSAGAAKNVALVLGAFADDSSLKAKTTLLPSGHVAMLSHPTEVAKVIEEAAADGHRR